jgi:uncharacterized membrane protein YgaE (UPF0421/DUF939 family)
MSTDAARKPRMPRAESIGEKGWRLAGVVLGLGGLLAVVVVAILEPHYYVLGALLALVVVVILFSLLENRITEKTWLPR